MNDWGDLSRLLPEVSILVVVGYFSLKCLNIFRAILTEMDERNGKNYKKLITAIDRNTKATTNADKYLRDRNGRDAELHRENIKAIKQIVPAMQEMANSSVKTVVDNIQHINKQQVDKQVVKQQDVK